MSTSAKVRELVSSALDRPASTPSKAPKAGLEMELDDGRTVVYRLIPGQGWEGELLDPNGDHLRRLAPVSRLLSPADVADRIVEEVRSLDREAA